MADIEERLTSYKKQINKTKIPDDLDAQLKQVLNTVPTRKNIRSSLFVKIAMVAAIILIGLAGYNHHALAFYSKKILGFDNLYGTLGQLNEDEMGQVIEKTIKLEDGLYFTVNGIMTDPNQLVLFYTFSAPEGVDQFDTSQYSLSSISGFMTNAGAHGGSGYTNAEGTEEKWIYNFDPVNPLARNLTLTIFNWDNDTFQEITIPHDPNKAMKASIDTPIDKTIHLDKGSITFDSITATPTMTLLKGTIDIAENIHFLDSLIGIKLLGNDLTVGRGGGGTSTEDGKPTTFEIRYDALPDGLNDLKIAVENFIGFSSVNDTIELNKETIGEAIDFHGHEIMVTEVNEKPDHMEVKIRTDEHTTLGGLALVTKDGRTEMQEMIMEEYKMPNEIERTYAFTTLEIPTSLSIEGIYFMKPYGKEINIPIK